MFWFDGICLKRLFRGGKKGKKNPGASREEHMVSQRKQRVLTEYSATVRLHVWFLQTVKEQVFLLCMNSSVQQSVFCSVFFFFSFSCHWTEGSSVLAGGMCVFAHTHVCLSSLFLFPLGQKITIQSIHDVQQVLSGLSQQMFVLKIIGITIVNNHASKSFCFFCFFSEAWNSTAEYSVFDFGFYFDLFLMQLWIQPTDYAPATMIMCLL